MQIKTEFTPQMAKLLRGITLKDGPAQAVDFQSDHKLCVMQAVAYITGEDTPKDGWLTAVTDRPLCVSQTICDAMIDINDNCTDRQRAQLKRLVPEVIGTAPVRSRGSSNQFAKKGEPMRDERNPEYRDAERRRGEILKERITLGDDTNAFGKRVDIVRELLAVA